MGKINTPTSEPVIADSPSESKSELSDFIEEVDIDFSTNEDVERFTNEPIRLMSLKSALGLDPSEMGYDKEIKQILDWAKSVGLKNRNQLVSKIKEVQYKVGRGDDSADTFRKVYQYIKLDSTIKSLVNQQEGLREQGNRSGSHKA